MLDRIRKAIAVLVSKDAPGPTEEKGTTGPPVLVSPQMSGRPIYKDWDTGKGIRDAFKASHWVYACVRVLMRTISSVPWYVEVRQKGEWKRAEGHELELLMARPNPFMSGQDLIERTVAHLYLGGNGLWRMIGPDGRPPKELWPYHPDTIKPVPDAIDFIRHYETKVGNKKDKVPANEVIHMMFANPDNVFWGMSPIQALATTIDTEVEARNWNKVSLQNRCEPSGVYQADAPLTMDQWTNVRKQLLESHMGSDNARNPMVLGGVKWEKVSMTPIEMDFLESRKFSVVEICAGIGVPPPLVQYYEDATLANIDTAKRILWEETNIPTLTDIEGALNLGLAVKWGPDVRIRYDLSKVGALNQLYGEKVNQAERLQRMGYTLNQVNERLQMGFDNVPWGDRPMLPVSMMPIDDEPAPDPARKPTADDSKPVDQEVEKALTPFGREVKSIDGPRYWKAFEQARTPWYKSVRKQVQRVLKAERKAVLSAVRSGGDFEAAVDKGAKAWTRMLTGVWTELVDTFGTATFNRLKSGRGPSERKDDETFDPTDAEITSAIKKWVAEKVTGINATSKARIRLEVEQGQDAGESTSQIAGRIESLFDDMEDGRAEVIARTEVIGASNFGSHSAAEQMGMEEKTWVDSGDDRVRDEHESINGETVAIDELYSSGLMFPGDPNGDAGQVVGCRCVEVYS